MPIMTTCASPMATDGDSDTVPVHEGKVIIHQPKSVFYNKVQEFNRDLRYEN
jgi:tRNA G26 N,N-dimethylase Trm1